MALHYGVKGSAAGIPERKIGEHKTRNATRFDNVTRASENHRGNAMGFQMPGNQTHGLVTDGSNGGKHGNIHLVLDTPAQDFRRIHLAGFTLTVLRENNMEARRQTGDASFGGEGMQVREW